MGVHTRHAVLTALLLGLSTVEASAAPPGPDTAKVQKAIKDLERICRADAGALWGGSLCAPVLVVDAQSRRFVASEAPKEGEYKGPPFTGDLPNNVTVANTATEWAGTLWVQLLWPLPDDATARRVLMSHEAFHHLQRRKGLALREAANPHLDTARGRTLIQLEWRALAKALDSRGEKRRAAVQDALAFRAARRAAFPQAAETERAMEFAEGLAEYTGVRLGTSNAVAARAHAKGALQKEPERATLVRTFISASGPAYGLLLDETAGAGWRTEALGGADLGDLLARALHVEAKPPSEEELTRLGQAYGAPALEKREAERERLAQERLVTLRKRFVEGPVLRLPLVKMNIQFRTDEIVPIEGVGTVYSSAKIVAAWGNLEARTGVLVDTDWKNATVPLPLETRDGKLRGDGWELELSTGWEQAPGEREGDVTLRKHEG